MTVVYKESFIDQEKVDLPPSSVFYNVQCILTIYPSWMILCVVSFHRLDRIRPFCLLQFNLVYCDELLITVLVIKTYGTCLYGNIDMY